MYQPLVSVIIPTYNRTGILPKAVNSVLSQTYKNLELLIVDDGSNDDTFSVAKKLISEDTRARYLKNDLNEGGCKARNKGLKEAKGDFVAFLDSDDEWLEDKLELQVKIFEKSLNNKLGAVYGGILLKRTDNTIFYYRPRFAGNVEDKLLWGEIFICGSALLFKKEVFLKCGVFDENPVLRSGGRQDHEMWLRVAKKYEFDYADDLVLYYNLHKDSVSVLRTRIEHARALEYIINKHLDAYEKNRKLLASLFLSLGSDYMLNNKTANACSLFLRAIKYNQFSLRGYFHLILAVFGSKIYSILFNIHHTGEK